MGTVRIQQGNGGWLQSHQFLDSFRRVAFCSLFQQSSEQDKRDDDTGGFKIDMGMNAAARPEFRPEQIEKAEDICDACADGHQRVHVRRAVFQLFPGVAIEIPSQPEDHGGSQYPHHVVGISPVHETHADDGYRDRQGQGAEGAELQFLVFLHVCVFCNFFFVSAGVDDQVVASCLDGTLQHFR